jgi:anti-sigma28 factor (negative regulator of flagellin synthesis)
VKINRVDSMGPAGSSNAVAETAAAEPPTAPATQVDRISTNQTSEVRASVEAGVTMAASERSERLHHLTQAVRSGTYRPNASQLAEQILAEAELDARLSRSFN